MDTAGVDAFLASVGSPLADGGAEIQKHLPSSAVIQLLSAKIEAASGADDRAATPEPTASSDDGDMSIDEEAVSTFKDYAYATAQYAYTSEAAQIAVQLRDAIQAVAQVQDAVTKRDGAALPLLLERAAATLQVVGVQLDLPKSAVKILSPDDPVTRSATVTELASLCRTLLADLPKQIATDWAQLLSIEREGGHARLEIKSAEVEQAWTYAEAGQCADAVAAQVTAAIADKISPWLLTEGSLYTTNESAGALLLTRTPSGKASPIDGLVHLLAFLRESLFLKSAPAATEQGSLAPRLQVLVAHRWIPSLVIQLKSYWDRILTANAPTWEAAALHAQQVAKEAVRVHDELVRLRYTRETTGTGASPAIPGWARLENLSDLKTWAKHVQEPKMQTYLGTLLAQVRTILVQTDDKAWDTVVVQRKQAVQEVTPAAQAATKPSAAEPAPNVSAARPIPPAARAAPIPRAPATAAAPAANPADALSASSKQAPKRTLGGVKKLGAQALKKPIVLPEPDDDDWGWGDDDFDDGPAASPLEQAPETPQAAPASDEDTEAGWDWGSDTEVDAMLDEPQPAPPPSVPSVQASAHKSPTHRAPAPNQTVECKVSQRCLATAKCIEQSWHVLETATDPKLGATLAQAILESFQLYRALMPAVHATSLQHVPMLSMLFANDCDYLASCMESYAEKASNLPGPARTHHATELTSALRREAHALRAVGSQWRDAQVALQAAALDDCLDDTDGFARTEEDVRYAACERAVFQVGHILHHLAAVWRPVLTIEVLVRLLGELVQGVFVRVLRSMEALDDISEPESTRLASLCRTLLEAQTALFAFAADTTPEAASALAATAVPSWFQFSYLPELLTGSLVDIEYLLFESGGALLDYDREEILGLIRALFADTPNRRRLMERIQRTPWSSAQTESS